MSRNLGSSGLKWAHGINSLDGLRQALLDGSNFIEADVSFGICKYSKMTCPMMAHSSLDDSEISLSEWLIYFKEKNHKNKGLKLDFKDVSIILESAAILNQAFPKAPLFEVWLNADILQGLGNPTQNPVDAKSFIKIFKSLTFPFTWSLGWTTSDVCSDNVDDVGYSWKIVEDMHDILVNNKIIDDCITFAVNVAYCCKSSIEPLQWLQNNVPGSTLTAWGHKTGGEFGALGLIRLQSAFSTFKLFVDVPDCLRKYKLK